MFLPPCCCGFAMEESVHAISCLCIELGNLESTQEDGAALDCACSLCLCLKLNGVNISINEKHLNSPIMPCNIKTLLHRKCGVRIFIHELQNFAKRTSERSERVSFQSFATSE